MGFNDISFSGRNAEVKRLRNYLKGSESELLSVIGRRRVGKTFLVKKVYEKEMVFHMTGIRDASKSDQLENFSHAVQKWFKLPDLQTPKNWLDAFHLLAELIEKKKYRSKKVLFFDELPWLASPRSGFLQAFDYFWNSWASQHNLVIVICGSAATWMIKNVINDKGGLHNRVTGRIHLQPFTLSETEQYFKDRKINLPRYDIIKLYMAIGGIPFYLRNVQQGDTAIQAIDRFFYGRNAILKGEFDNLYRALFNNYETHVEVIKALASKRQGLTRKQLLDITDAGTGGTFTQVLRELEESSFISSYLPLYKKERETLYRLTDEYSMFYLSFIVDQKTPKGGWIKKANNANVSSWQGYTFESICYKHVDSIKKEMGIDGIYSEQASYLHKKTEDIPGFQIDLLIDRKDNAINICEAKFYNTEYILTAREAEKMRTRKALFKTATRTKKQLLTTLISTYGLSSANMQSGVDVSLDMNALFHSFNM